MNAAAAAWLLKIRSARATAAAVLAAPAVDHPMAELARSIVEAADAVEAAAREMTSALEALAVGRCKLAPFGYGGDASFCGTSVLPPCSRCIARTGLGATLEHHHAD